MSISIQDPRLAALASEVAVAGAITLTGSAFGVLHACADGTYTVTLPTTTGNNRKTIAAYNTGVGIITFAGTFGPSNDSTIGAGQVIFLVVQGSEWVSQVEATGASSAATGDESNSRSWFGI